MNQNHVLGKCKRCFLKCKAKKLEIQFIVIEWLCVQFDDIVVFEQLIVNVVFNISVIVEETPVNCNCL